MQAYNGPTGLGALFVRAATMATHGLLDALRDPGEDAGSAESSLRAILSRQRPPDVFWAELYATIEAELPQEQVGSLLQSIHTIQWGYWINTLRIPPSLLNSSASIGI